VKSEKRVNLGETRDSLKSPILTRDHLDPHLRSPSRFNAASLTFLSLPGQPAKNRLFTVPEMTSPDYYLGSYNPPFSSKSLKLLNLRRKCPGTELTTFRNYDHADSLRCRLHDTCPRTSSRLIYAVISSLRSLARYRPGLISRLWLRTPY